MKLLLDQGLPRSAAVHLQNRGFEAKHVGNLGMSAAEDSEILARAAADGEVVITLDSDFHTILAHSRATRPSVIRVRVEGLKGEALAALLLKVLEPCREDLENGAAITIQGERARIQGRA